jgi:hypothetical protein
LLVIGQVWAFLLFVPFLTMITAASNRYCWCWSTTPLVLLFALVTGLGLALTLSAALLRLAAPRWFGTIAGLAALGMIAVLVWWWLFSDETSLLRRLIYAALVLVITGGLADISWKRGWGLAAWKRLATGTTLFLAPVVPIFWIHALCLPRYPVPPIPPLEQARSIPDRSGDLPQDNIYLFVFDEWPYRLTFQKDEVVETMPRLAEFSRQMTVFTQAHSPGCHTVMSMPRLLFQRTDPFALRGDQVGFWDGQFHPTLSQPSLFTAARQRGYRTYMIGWYHPYHVMLGPTVDFVCSAGYFNELGDSTDKQLRYFSWDATLRLLGLGLGGRLVGQFMVMRNQAVVWQNEMLLEYTRAVFDDPRPQGQFAVFHLPLPHWPYCYCASGVKPLHLVYSSTSEDMAREQLIYMDQVVGELLDQLKARGCWDNSTIILTSDHNWRLDPNRDTRSADFLSHVPLLIRFPGQDRRVTIGQPFSTVHLANVLESSRASDFQPADLERLVRAQRWYEPLDQSEVYLEKPLEP